MIDDDNVFGVILEMFVWFILCVEDGDGVDVDVAWRALRVAFSMMFGFVVSVVVVFFEFFVVFIDCVLVFVSKLIMEIVVGLIEIFKDELRDVVRLI